MKDSEILTLVDRLERCLLATTEFHHRDHLTVAVVYLYSSDFAAALDRMRSSLLRFVAHHGGNLYHETLTRFWMVQVERHLDRNVCLEESVRRVTEALPDKNLVSKYYSAKLLASAEAKQTWVEPDLARLNTQFPIGDSEIQPHISKLDTHCQAPARRGPTLAQRGSGGKESNQNRAPERGDTHAPK